MFGRSFLLLAILAAAVGVPNWTTGKDLSTTVKDAWRWLKGEAREDGQIELTPQLGGKVGSLQSTPVAGGPAPIAVSDVNPSRPLLEGVPVQDLAEVLRFDVDPRWVMGRWSRVSTGLADLKLDGLRVPLVTGTSLGDLAGSLTYYFDQEHRVRRITFQGHTGDERKLVAVLTGHYGFRPEPGLGAGLYLVKWNGRPTSALRVRHAPVIRAGAPHSRLDVILEINRPGRNYRLSEAFQKTLDEDHQAQQH